MLGVKTPNSGFQEDLPHFLLLFAFFQKTLDAGRIGVAGQALGIAQVIFDSPHNI